MLNKKNKVSVVLCTYNGSKYLEKQLESILKQSYQADEIVIVDDCSSDSTREILEEYQKKHKEIKLFFNNENIGPILSFRYALSLAENDYIVLCDQDDIWFQNKIDVQMNLVLHSEFYNEIKPLLVFHDLTVIDQNDNITNKSFWQLHKFKPQNFTFKKSLSFNIVTGCTCLINKVMKDEIVKCNMDGVLMHDHLIALVGYGFGNVIYTNEPLIYYRSHFDSVTAKEKIMLADRIRNFISKIIHKNYMMPSILQIQSFDKVYGIQLDNSSKKIVERFLGLKDQSVFSRIFYRFFPD